MQSEKTRNQALKLLQERRRTKVLRYAYLDDQCRSIAAGLCLRKALLDNGIDYSKSRFTEGAKGKLSFEKDCGLHFNMSHCGDLAICLISDQPIGADLEGISMKHKKLENLEKIAGRSFTTEENEFFLSGEDEEEKRLRFAKIFTGKEAYGKYLGVGIGYEMKEYSVMDNPLIYTFLFDDYVISVAANSVDPDQLKLKEVEWNA